jgi:hypothetical protein
MSSCKKVDTHKELGDAGETIVKLTVSDSAYRLVAVNAVTTSQVVGLLQVRRDVPNEAELNSTTKVVIIQDQGIVTSYNTKFNKEYVALPESSYSANADNPRNGNTWTVTFNPGEFIKDLKISINNAAGLDFSKQYALGFRIQSVDGNGKISQVVNQKTVVVEVGIKNRWDGEYRVTGSLTDLTTTAITGFYPITFQLVTTGANTVAVIDKFYGFQTHSITNAGSRSRYGDYGLNLTFDPATNKITSVVNSFGQPASNGRSAALDPTGINAYDPATKTIKIKYLMLQPGTTVRTIFDETWVYQGPR